MGLDTTHNCFHGPYGTFNRFRISLGLQIGIDLNDFVEYGGMKSSLNDFNHDLKPLFNHSDCDGELTPKESEQIIKGLNSVLENFNEKLPQDFNFKEKIIQFRDGLIEAVSKNENVIFQ